MNFIKSKHVNNLSFHIEAINLSWFFLQSNRFKQFKKNDWISDGYQNKKILWIYSLCKVFTEIKTWFENAEQKR